jgi:hypothetical protein
MNVTTKNDRTMEDAKNHRTMEETKSEILKRFRIDYSVFKINHSKMGLVQEVVGYIAATANAKKDSKFLSIPADLMDKLITDTSKVVFSVKNGSTVLFSERMYLTIGGNYIVHEEKNIFGNFCLSGDVTDMHELGLSSSPEPLTLYINDVEVGTLPDKALTSKADLNCEDENSGVTYAKIRQFRKQLRFPKMKIGKCLYKGSLSAVDGKWSISIG